jgi:hypothetical protein
MSKRFFKLADDVRVSHRWDLGTPTDRQGQPVDDRHFTCGVPVDMTDRLKIPVEVAGKPLDFTEAGVGLPVVHVRVAPIFAELAPDDVQLLPVDVEGQPDQYLILVATRVIDCIDEKTSRFDRWTPEEGVLHDIRRYSIMYKLCIDKAKVGSTRVFRPEGWTVVLIVSGELKDALERVGATGTRFEEV